MVTASPPVSPSVVAKILMIQKTSVTCGTLATRFDVFSVIVVPSEPSVGNFVWVRAPLAEQLSSRGGRKLNHRQRTSRQLQRNLLVNEIIVESDRGRIHSGRRKINAVEPGPVNRRETHRTGLATREENAAAQLETLQRTAGIADRRHLRVRGRIEQMRNLVRTAPDDFSIGDHDRAERSAAVFAHAGASEGDRFVHPARVLSGVVNGI